MNDSMSGRGFVASLRAVVRDRAIGDAIALTESPPGRKLSQMQKDRAAWYGSLSPDQKNMFRSVVADAVDGAIFGVLCVIDGVRAVEEGADKGDFEIHYIKRGRQGSVLNKGVMLHDFYGID